MPRNRQLTYAVQILVELGPGKNLEPPIISICFLHLVGLIIKLKEMPCGLGWIGGSEMVKGSRGSLIIRVRALIPLK